MLAAIFHHHLVLNPSKSVSLWQHTCATSYQGLWQSNSLSANVALLQSRSALLPAFYSNPNIYSKYKHGWQGRKAAFCCGQFFYFFFITTWWESSFFPQVSRLSEKTQRLWLVILKKFQDLTDQTTVMSICKRKTTSLSNWLNFVSCQASSLLTRAPFPQRLV